MRTEDAARAFGFRPWVRSSCRRAMVWGLGILALLGGVAWLFRSPEETLGRAFGVLLLYGLLFWATLFKIWWTARRPAVVLDAESLSYQPLHAFRPRRIPYDRILACAPRPGTHSLRLVVDEPRRIRELFLNLAVVRERHALMDELGVRLERAGLAPHDNGWSRPQWREPGTGALSV